MKDFYVSKSHDDNVGIAREILSGTAGLNRQHAHIIGLTGELGSGKTTWTKGLVEALGGHASDVQSPTYVLMNDYTVEDKTFGFKNVHHLDVYRLEDGKALNTLNLDEWLNDPTKLIVIEWWKKVSNELSDEIRDSVVELSFETINDFTKTITLN